MQAHASVGDIGERSRAKAIGDVKKTEHKGAQTRSRHLLVAASSLATLALQAFP